MKNNKNYEYNEVEKVTTIREIMDKAGIQAGDKIAFKYKEGNDIKEVKYNEFIEDIFSLGTALSKNNIASTHVAVVGENSYKWLTVYLTILESNGVIVPIDKELPLQDMINILSDSDSEVLFYADKYEKHIDELKAKAPKIKYFIGFSREEDGEKVLSYNKLIESGRKDYKAGDKIFTSIEHKDLNKLKMLVYTSGTTGNAKGVMLSEKNLVGIVYHGLRISTVYSRCLSVLPYHHTYEAVAGILVSLHHHSCICINENIKMTVNNLKLYKPDYIYLVPAFVELFYKKIWTNAKETKKDVALKIMIKVSNFLRIFGIDLRKKLFKSIHEAFGGNLIKIVTGGAPIRAELGIFFDSIGIDLINGYGITECSPLVSANRDYFNDCATVGVLLPCVEVKFENVTPEGDGEILVKGDTVMLGYYKNEKLTAEVLKEGWFYTGDYGKMNDKGQLLITGRKKNLIVLENGKNIFPEEIENYIMGIPYVTEVVVRGIKNEAGAETGLLAEVFLNEEKLNELNITNKEESLKQDISTACRELPIYKKITKIIIRDEQFNKTTTNKIKR